MKKEFLLLFTAVVAAVSCSKVDNTTPVDDNQIHFSSGIETKAPISGAVPGTAISGIQILRAPDAATAVWTSVSAVTTTADINAEGAVSPATAQYYAADNNKKAWFMAYYPVATAIAADKVSWTITGQEDIIVAPEVSAGSKDNKVNPTILAFAHKLSLLKFKVKGADAASIADWGTVTYIKVNSETGMELTPSTGVFTKATGSTTADLTVANATFPLTLTTAAADAGSVMVYPGTLGAVKVKTSLGNEQTITIAGLSTIVAGESHEITLTFTATGITVTATLADWTTGTAGTGDVQ